MVATDAANMLGRFAHAPLMNVSVRNVHKRSSPQHDTHKLVNEGDLATQAGRRDIVVECER